MGKNRDVTERERYWIEVLLSEKKSIKEIAVRLNRHYQTIYREVRRGTVELIDSELCHYKKYCADYAQKLADDNKRQKGRDLKIANDFEFVRFAEKMILEKKYSPCAVLAYIRNNNLLFRTSICYTTFYHYIDSGVFLNVTNKNLPVKSKRKKNTVRKVRSVSVNNLKGRSIEERDERILFREDFGHWEMDTVVGGKNCSKDVLLVLTERKTRYEYIFKIPDKTQNSVIDALDKLESVLGFDEFCRRFKTITMDNGVEFLDMEHVERSCFDENARRALAYYCHPYCSFERGSNENANKLIRRHVPKGADIGAYSDDDILAIQDWVNTYPRKLFDWRCSADLFVGA